MSVIKLAKLNYEINIHSHDEIIIKDHHHIFINGLIALGEFSHD